MYLGCDLSLPVTLEIALKFWKYSDGNLLVKLLWERSMTCNLDKPKFIWGSHIGPWNPFARKTRIYNSSKDFNQKGNVSFNLLFPRFRTSIILHLTNDREIFPCICLWFQVQCPQTTSIYECFRQVSLKVVISHSQYYKRIAWVKQTLWNLTNQLVIWHIKNFQRIHLTNHWRNTSCQFIFWGQKINCRRWGNWNWLLQHIGT